MITAEALGRYRGPYMLTATRRVSGKQRHESCTLAKSVSRDEVIELAESSLRDPRDTIEAVYVWAGIEAYCIGWMR